MPTRNQIEQAHVWCDIRINRLATLHNYGNPYPERVEELHTLVKDIQDYAGQFCPGLELTPQPENRVTEIGDYDCGIIRANLKAIRDWFAEHPEPEPVGMNWQEAADRMERLRKQGEPFTSQHKMAGEFGCSVATVHKAIRLTPSLHGWAKFQAAPRAQSITPVVTDGTAQSTELDPADEAAIREFVEKTDPDVKAWFLSLPAKEQLDYLNDPDKHAAILGRKP